MIKNINFKANIQANAQDLVVSNQKDVKESVAYNIDVPADSATYTTVNKVGGMTRKCANLIPRPYYSEGTHTLNGITWTVNADGSVTANGTATANSICVISNYNTKVSAGTYTFSGVPADGGSLTFMMQTADKNGFAWNNVHASGDKFTLAADTSLLFQLVVFAGYTANNLVFKPMLNEGEPKPYEPYFEGLRSAKVTAVESVGVNLFDVSALSDTDVLKVVDGVIKVTTSNLDSSVNTYKTFGEVCPNLKVGDFVTVRAITTGNEKYIYLTKLGVVGFGNAFTVTEDALTSNVFFYASGINTTAEISEMMVTKDANAPYAPYTHHILPIPVEVRGSENLFSPPIKGVSLNPVDGSQDASDTSATTDYIPVHMSDGDYCISGLPNNLWYFVAFYDSDKNFLNRTGAGPNVSTYESLVDLAGEANVGPSRVSYIRITIYENPTTSGSGSITSIDNLELMMNRGTTPTPYEPYSAVKGLDGYGLGVSDTVYNYIDWEKKQFVKRCAMVDLGTLEWRKTPSGNNTYIASVYGMQNAKTDEERKQGWICEKYNASSEVDNTKLDDKSAIRYITNSSFYIRDDDYTDAETFKAAMSGVMLVYELATPEVTDISDIISADNFIEVEGSGTITFKNAYEYAVPSEVTLYEGDNEIIGSKTFVGDLIGEAGRAKKATMAVYDESGNKIDETYLSKSGGIMTGSIIMPHGTSIRNNSGNQILEYRGSDSDGSGTRVGDYDDRMVLLTSGDDLWHFNHAAGGDGKILDTLNYSSYALPLSGGTLGGQVVANASAVATLETKQVRNIYAGTSDLTAGSSALPTGDIYIVYE